MTSTTWAIASAKLSVAMNGICIPFASAPDATKRFVRPALFSTGDEAWEIRTSGTVVLCKYQDLTLAIGTAHQVGDGCDKPLPERFVILTSTGNGTIAIPPKAVRRPFTGEVEYASLNDLLILDFDEKDLKLDIAMIDLGSVRWSDDAELTVEYSFLVGYPTAFFDADINDEGECQRLENKWIRQDLEPGKSELMDVENRDIFVKHSSSTRSSIEPDGLSGSPVFSIVRDGANNCHLRFEGIVTNARGDRFAVYPSIYIRRVLDQIAMEHKRNIEDAQA